MDFLNYHHLHYFWVVAQEGGISRACEKLHVTQPTVSGQLRQLEKTLGGKLYERRGQSIALTDLGQLVFGYADEIFTTGRELLDAVRGVPTGQRIELRVGIPDFVPKLVAHQLVRPALDVPESVKLVCREGTLPSLLADLAVHALDVVISDEPSTGLANLRVFNHRLGASDVAVFGESSVAAELGPTFPESLQSAPVLSVTSGSKLRFAFENWLDERGIEPIIAAEFTDPALMKTFARDGLGLFVAPIVIAEEIRTRYGLEIVGRVDGVKDTFYAISVERRIRHPAVVAISEAAHDWLDSA